jgi:plastocyanin
MKQYIAIIFLLVLITACAPVVEIEDTQPIEDIEKPAEVPQEEPVEPAEELTEISDEDQTEQETEVTILEDSKETTISENIIGILSDSFSPIEKIITKNTEITWINKDSKQHKIACYLNGARVVTSSNLDQGDQFSYRFVTIGDYTCIDAIYGLRSTIIVEVAPLLSPTGEVILDGTGGGSYLGVIALLAISILVFFIYSRKR